MSNAPWQAGQYLYGLSSSEMDVNAGMAAQKRFDFDPLADHIWRHQHLSVAGFDTGMFASGTADGKCALLFRV